MKITEMFLTPNKFSRPQIKLQKVTKIATHYAGDAGAKGINLRNYFEGLKNQRLDPTGVYCVNADGSFVLYKGQKVKARWVSSHFIIGLEGEVIQCIPEDEWSYCTNQANGYSISIECCHPDSTGKFTGATEKSLVELCAYLCAKHNLSANDIIRHYDVTGKQCPLYWAPTKYQPKEVADGRFNEFKAKVAKLLGEKAEPPPTAEAENKLPYKVKVVCDELNVRKEAGTQAKITCKVTKNYIYTIVEETKVGNVPWGKLASGAGWISLLDKYVKKL